MTRPLVWLFLATRRNWARRFVAGLWRPRRLLGLLATVGILVLIGWNFAHASGSAREARAAAAPMLRAYLSLVLLMSLLGGLSERGIAFRPADVDFLFPGPFRRRALVLYHLADQAPAVALGAVLPFAIFGAQAPHPGLALVGCLLSVFAAQHVRVFASLAVVHVGERAFRRLRAPLRWILTLLVIGLVAFLLLAATRAGGLREAVGRSTSSPVARVLLYPATVAGDLAEAPSLGRALLSLLGGLAAVAATLVAVLLVQVNFLEESIGVSERWAARRARLRRSPHAAASQAEEAPVRAVRLPVLGAFRGAGALVWKNLVVARRSARSIFFSVAFGTLLVAPMLAGAKGREPGFVLVYLAVLPMLLSASLAFDFRGEGVQLGALRTLPISRTWVALAEVTVPAAITLLCQAAYLGAVLAFDLAPPALTGLAFVGCVPLTVTMVATTNLAWFWAPRGAGAALLQLLFLLGDAAVLGAVAFLLDRLGVPARPAVVALFLAQCAVLVLVLALLGRAFERGDLPEEAAGAP